MTTATTTLRTLLMYAVVLPLAIWIGYLVANSGEAGRYTFWWNCALIMGIICLPLLLKWHHALLFLTWNMTAVIFFLPGRPQIWLAMAFTSLILSMVQRALLRDIRWIHAPSVVMPVLFLGVVVYVTGSVQDGRDFLFNVRVFGSQVVGSKAYYWIFGGIIGLLAMISRPVPPHKAVLYMGLFFLGAITNAVGSLVWYVPSQLWFIFLFFPVDAEKMMQPLGESEMSRFYGLSLAAMACLFYVCARHGVQGIMQWKHLRRLLLAAAMVVITAASGFRGYFILLGLIFALLFYFEGLIRTKYMAIVVATAALALVIVVPFATRLPLSIQRTLSFLPIPVDPVAAADARGTTEWRIQMWKELLPAVPGYLWLGKGLGVSGVELQGTEELFGARSRVLSQHEAALLVGNYHNGPLTIIISFGIWGAIGLLWFFGASIHALYLNYVYGDENLKNINRFLLAYFVARVIWYLTIFGDFRNDFAIFCGIIGLNLALNGGIHKRERVHRLVQPLTLQRFRPMLRTAPEREAVSPAPSQ